MHAQQSNQSCSNQWAVSALESTGNSLAKLMDIVLDSDAVKTGIWVFKRDELNRTMTQSMITRMAKLDKAARPLLLYPSSWLFIYEEISHLVAADQKLEAMAFVPVSKTSTQHNDSRTWIWNRLHVHNICDNTLWLLECRMVRILTMDKFIRLLAKSCMYLRKWRFGFWSPCWGSSSHDQPQPICYFLICQFVSVHCRPRYMREAVNNTPNVLNLVIFINEVGTNILPTIHEWFCYVVFTYWCYNV